MSIMDEARAAVARRHTWPWCRKHHRQLAIITADVRSAGETTDVVRLCCEHGECTSTAEVRFDFSEALRRVAAPGSVFANPHFKRLGAPAVDEDGGLCP